MPRECVGVALGAQVRHVVTYRDYRFHQKVSKTVKNGVPPVFNPFSGKLTPPVYPHPRMAPRMANLPPPPGGLPGGGEFITS